MEFLSIFFFVFLLKSILAIQTNSQDQPKRILIQSKCTSDSNCTAHAYCHASGKCFCKNGYIMYRYPDVEKEAYHTVCLKEAKYIEDYCRVDIQCKSSFGIHSTCHHADPQSHVGQCQCLNNAHFKDGLCYKTALIGEICDVNDNCLIKSKDKQAFCDHSLCICPPEHIPTIDKTDCQLRSELEGPCLDDTGCSTPNSKCRRGFCRCKEKYISGSLNYCFLLAEKLEDPCDEDDQCTTFLPNTRCDEIRKVCVCENNPQNNSTLCLKQENKTKTNDGRRLLPNTFVFLGLLLLIMTITESFIFLM